MNFITQSQKSQPFYLIIVKYYIKWFPKQIEKGKMPCYNEEKEIKGA